MFLLQCLIDSFDSEACANRVGRSYSPLFLTLGMDIQPILDEGMHDAQKSPATHYDFLQLRDYVQICRRGI